MTKTFANRFEAERDLSQHGFKPQLGLLSPWPNGQFTNDQAIATVHPIPGSDKVRVAYVLRG